MFYEVFIPARDSEEFDTTITVEAGNWMVALKSGLDRTGQLGDGIRNVMCDIKDDNSIHVTDGASRRVFVLKEVSAPSSEKSDASAEDAVVPESPKIQIDEGTKTEPMSVITEADRPKTASNVSIELEPEIKESSVSVDLEPENKESSVSVDLEPEIKESSVSVDLEPENKESSVSVDLEPEVKESSVSVSFKSEAEVKIPEASVEVSLEEKSYTSADGRISIGSATYESLKREDEPVKIIHEARAPSGTRPAVVVREASTSSISQNILEDVFLEMQQIHEGMEMQQVIEFVMNISMEKIRAEAGSIMFADISGTELYFAAARGPKADDIMDFRIPMGVGIVGFCVREGVSLAIGDVEKDPRFYKAISEKLGYETRNLCCVPIQHEGRVYGAIELMNKKEVFATQEVNALTYIGGQMAKYIHDLIMAQEKI